MKVSRFPCTESWTKRQQLSVATNLRELGDQQLLDERVISASLSSSRPIISAADFATSASSSRLAPAMKPTLWRAAAELHGMTTASIFCGLWLLRTRILLKRDESWSVAYVATTVGPP